MTAAAGRRAERAPAFAARADGHTPAHRREERLQRRTRGWRAGGGPSRPYVNVPCSASARNAAASSSAWLACGSSGLKSCQT